VSRHARLAILFALAVLLPATHAVAGPIPRLLVAVPADADAAALRPLAACTSPGCAAVAPPVDADGPPAADTGVFQRLVSALPAGTGLFLRVRLSGATRTGQPEADQQALGAALARLVESLPLANTRVNGVVLDVQALGDAELLRYQVATFALAVKSTRPGIEIIVALPQGALAGLGEAARRLAAYCDTIALGDTADWRDEVGRAASSLQRPTALVARAGQGADGAALAARYLDLLVGEGPDVALDAIVVTEGNAQALAGLLGAYGVLARSIPAASNSAQRGASPVTFADEGGGAVAARRFVAGQSADEVALVRIGGTAGSARPLLVTHARPGFDISCADAATGRRLPATATTAPAAGSAARCAVDVSHVLVSLHRKEADDRVFESVTVAGRAELRVEEVIARWQQFREAQRRALAHYTANCLLSLHFEPAGFGSGFDVSVRLREFTAGADREWVQNDFLVNGVRFGNRRGFPLPQLEPEKVVTKPLDLSLDERYRYVLEGIETVDGVLCYVVRFEPTRQDETLYSGKVWIDGVTFRQVRLALQQRGGSASNVVSHAETQEFQLVTSEGRQYNLFRAIAIQQVVNAAGRSLLLEKRYQFGDYAINAEGFEAEKAAARASASAMFQDTPDGLRSLKKVGDGRAIETVNTTRVRSLITGLFYEASYSVPIPMAGLSVADFNYRKTGTQVSLFFAGPILALNVSKQRTPRLRVGLDLALSALPSNNRRYNGATDVSSQGVWAWEETIGGLVSWQATPNWSLTGSSHWALNLFRGTSDRDAAFQVPGHGGSAYLTGESKLTKGGYAITTTVMSGNRLGWSRSFGLDGSEPLESRYWKYYAEVGKQFYIGSFTKAGLSASYYDGKSLDRFSRYQPSFLSRPRIHGIPGGADTFDAVGVIGGSYGFNAMEVVKFEGVYNHAWGRNKSESNRFRDYDGVEFNVSTAAPWGTLLQGTVSYAVRGNTDRYKTRWGLYLLLFKPL
jgi:hypothetical protein